MALPALKIEYEVSMEERVARLEVNIEHIRSDISEMKEMDQRLMSKIDGVKDSVAALALSTEKSFTALALSMENSFASLALSTEKSFASLTLSTEKSFASLALSTERSFGKLNFYRMVDRLWWVGISAGLLSVVAKAFGWI
jgi:hypothetical protein